MIEDYKRQLWELYLDQFLDPHLPEEERKWIFQGNFLEYEMPRQSGITTYMINMAIKLSTVGYRVTYVVNRSYFINEFKSKYKNTENINFLTIDVKSLELYYHAFRGKSYDYIFIDNVDMKLDPTLIPVISTSKAILKVTTK